MTKERWHPRNDKGAERLDKLIELARRGYRTDEVTKGLDRLDNEEHRPSKNRPSKKSFRLDECINANEIENFADYWSDRKVSFEREKHVGQVLGSLPYISTILHSLPYSNNDNLGIDLTVLIVGHHEYSPLLSTVFVQVKAKPLEKVTFAEVMSRRFEFDFKDAEVELAKRQYVTLIATESEEQIVTDFETQLAVVYSLIEKN